MRINLPSRYELRKIPNHYPHNKLDRTLNLVEYRYHWNNIRSLTREKILTSHLLPQRLESKKQYTIFRIIQHITIEFQDPLYITAQTNSILP